MAQFLTEDADKSDTLNLKDAELEKLKRNKEELFEKGINSIEQRIYDDNEIKNLLSTNDKLYFICGLIMAGLTIEGVNPLEVDDFDSNDDANDNDGTEIISRVKILLNKKNFSDDKIKMFVDYMKPVFDKRNLWKPNKGESIIKSVYKGVII